MGGKEAFSNYLLKACQEGSLFETTGYGYEIHKMSEMATAPLDNSPFPTSQASTFLISSVTAITLTTLLFSSRRSVRKAFHPSWEAYPGDEDNGSLSAWYIWSALDSIQPVQASPAMISNPSL